MAHHRLPFKWRGRVRLHVVLVGAFLALVGGRDLSLLLGSLSWLL